MTEKTIKPQMWLWIFQGGRKSHRIQTKQAKVRNKVQKVETDFKFHHGKKSARDARTNRKRFYSYVQSNKTTREILGSLKRGDHA